ncbi:MAG: hypothetical protein HYY40_12595 [Bacteroidetes bacterium]|nr:hypothetical protein [Bacteroidota bacterium]
MLSPSNKPVHALWIGETLSPVELLTLKSFLHHGHEFHLWIYSPLSTPVPGGVIIEDAGKIISPDKIFKRNFSDPACGGVGKGSYGSPFADIFRFKLLYEKGGWWTDMDVTCLKPFEFSTPLVFRPHPNLPVVGTVLKAPAKADFLLDAYEKTRQQCNEDTRDWLLPNRILNESVRNRGLEKFIVNNISNHDIWRETRRHIRGNGKIPADYYFIHWQNEEWRVRGIGKERFKQNSTFGRLLELYGVPFRRKSLADRMRLFAPGNFLTGTTDLY